MFRPTRKLKKVISEEAEKKLLTVERRGVLAVNGDEGYPYAVPVNYYYDEADGKIYFHSSKVGHKADSLKKCDKVCFTVYGNETVKDLAWAPYMQSVVIFGRCRPIADHAAAMSKLRQFAMKYFPNEEMVEQEIAVYEKAVQMYEITIEHLTSKEIQER